VSPTEVVCRPPSSISPPAPRPVASSVCAFARLAQCTPWVKRVSWAVSPLETRVAGLGSTRDLTIAVDEAQRNPVRRYVYNLRRQQRKARPPINALQIALTSLSLISLLNPRWPRGIVPVNYRRPHGLAAPPWRVPELSKFGHISEALWGAARVLFKRGIERSIL
jgi:hypothetical protein